MLFRVLSIHPKPEFFHFVVILQIPVVQFFSGMYVKQIIDFHFMRRMSSYAA